MFHHLRLLLDLVVRADAGHAVGYPGHVRSGGVK
jgi:hypothetical protein